jgi:arabinose-5-phosphate isomerase
MLSAGDIVMPSLQRSSLEITNILPSLRKIGTHLVAMTGRPDSVLGKEAELVLNTAVDTEACPLGLAPTCYTTACLVMGDALCISLMQRRGFSSEQYALFHPGGALGRRLLTRVEDLMSKDVPTVMETDLFKDVIYTVSDRRNGMTMVVNKQVKMTGIITDGDIRRAVQGYDDIINKTALDFMTRGFKKINARAQIEDALRMMTQNKITSLAVTENEQSESIVGLITIHDIIDCEK